MLKKNNKIPVLFLLMEFAPVNTTGNFRGLKFLKYINEFGIEPIVITFEINQAAQIFNAKIDENLLADLPKGITIYRIGLRPLKTVKNKIVHFFKIYFNTEDELAKKWDEKIMNELPSIILKHKPEAIFTSLPPFSCGKLASKISLKYKIPLFIDMRDLWAGWSSTPKNSYFHFKNIINKEKYIFKSATKIIGVTPQLIETFNFLHKNKFKDKFVFIPNGFDKELISINPFYNTTKDKIIIGYVGSFYYDPKDYNKINILNFHHIFKYQPIKEDWLYRTPFYFFSTLVKLFQIKPEYKSKIKIEFIGTTPLWLIDMVKDFNITEIVTHHGFVSSKRSIEIQKNFNYFLATSEKVIGKEHYCLPSKLFDYIGTNKPILGFVTDGIQKDFIKKSNLGKIFNPDNVEDSAIKLDKYLNQDKLFEPDINYLKQFHRKNIARKLAETIKNSI